MKDKNQKDDLGDLNEEWPEEGDFTEGSVLKGETVLKKSVEPKIIDVPFDKKEIKDSTKAEEAERYKKILLDLGFHKKENGDDKEQYVKKEGDIVIGRTFTEKLPTGKFWALKNNVFLKEPEVKELKIVRAFYALRDGNKTLAEAKKEIGIKEEKKEMPFTRGHIESETEGLIVSERREVAVQSPDTVIADAEKMATALYRVVEQQHLYMDISGKKYLQLEAWQLLGKFCNVHGVVESVSPVEYFGSKGFEARAAVKDNAGTVLAVAEAVCMDDETNWEGKPLYQLKSMAQTRALSKAYRSCLSFIVSIAGYSPTPLEEM